MILEAPFSGTLRRLVAEGIRPPCKPNECSVGMCINMNAPLVDDIHPTLTAAQWPDETTRKAGLPALNYVEFRHCNNCGEFVGGFHGVEEISAEEASKRVDAALNKVFRK